MPLYFTEIAHGGKRDHPPLPYVDTDMALTLVDGMDIIVKGARNVWLPSRNIKKVGVYCRPDLWVLSNGFPLHQVRLCFFPSRSAHVAVLVVYLVCKNSLHHILAETVRQLFRSSPDQS